VTTTKKILPVEGAAPATRRNVRNIRIALDALDARRIAIRRPDRLWERPGTSL
jgi:hypothetical protein